MKFRITNVDMNGYCGRERHPLKTDEGKIVRLIGTTVLDFETIEEITHEAVQASDNNRFRKFVDSDELAALTQTDSDGCEKVEQVYHCVDLSTGQILDLMEHEIEVVR